MQIHIKMGLKFRIFSITKEMMIFKSVKVGTLCHLYFKLKSLSKQTDKVNISSSSIVINIINGKGRHVEGRYLTKF